MSKIKYLNDTELGVIDTAINLLAVSLNVPFDLIVRILMDGADLNTVPHDRFQYMFDKLKTGNFVMPEQKARLVFKPDGLSLFKSADIPNYAPKYVLDLSEIRGIRLDENKKYIAVIKEQK